MSTQRRFGSGAVAGSGRIASSSYDEQVDPPAPQRAVQPATGALLEPAVELVLEVVLVDEAPTRLKAGLQIALQAIDDAVHRAEGTR